MARTRMPINKPAAYTSNIVIEAPAPKRCRGREVERCGYEGAACAPAGIQAQQSLCPIAERLSRTPVNPRELKAGIRGGNIA